MKGDGLGTGTCRRGFLHQGTLNAPNWGWAGQALTRFGHCLARGWPRSPALFGLTARDTRWHLPCCSAWPRCACLLFQLGTFQDRNNILTGLWKCGEQVSKQAELV